MMCDCYHNVSCFFYLMPGQRFFCKVPSTGELRYLFIIVKTYKFPLSKACNLVETCLEDFSCLVKVTLSLACALTGYQCYRRRCGGGDADSEAVLEGEPEKGKDFAVENNAYEFDEHSGDKEKSKEADGNTKL